MSKTGLFLVGSPDGGTTKVPIKTDAAGNISTASGSNADVVSAVENLATKDFATQATLAAVLAKLSAERIVERVNIFNELEIRTAGSVFSDFRMTDLSKYKKLQFIAQSNLKANGEPVPVRLRIYVEDANRPTLVYDKMSGKWLNLSENPELLVPVIESNNGFHLLNSYLDYLEPPITKVRAAAICGVAPDEGRLNLFVWGLPN